RSVPPPLKPPAPTWLSSLSLHDALPICQRRADRLVDAHVAQPLAQQPRLLLAHRRQRNVFLSLVTAFGIPRRLAVAGKQDSHAAAGPDMEECGHSPAPARRIV